MIRSARHADVPVILRLIRDLAEYERQPHEVKATEPQLREALFGRDLRAFVHVAEHDGDNGPGSAWSAGMNVSSGRS
jgi:N-acetylglutamate synthase-like GNAT family acetyltransferase